MNKSELIIFGRSPFISQVDVPALLERYTTVGLNRFGQVHPVDYLFCCDHYFKASFPKTQVYYSNLVAGGPWEGKKIQPVPADLPVLAREYQHGGLCLAFKCFTVSLAVNFGILEGFKKIYLVGIDHVEHLPRFHHFDGIAGYDPDTQSDIPDGHCNVEHTPDAHRQLKQFIYRCAEHVDIYQCNPAVADDWELKFKDVSELYAPQS